MGKKTVKYNKKENLLFMFYKNKKLMFNYIARKLHLSWVDKDEKVFQNKQKKYNSKTNLFFPLKIYNRCISAFNENVI